MIATVAEQTQRQQVIVVGWRPEDGDALPWDGADVNAVLSRRSYARLPDADRRRLRAALPLDLPGRNMDEYDQHVPSMAVWARSEVGPAPRVISLYEHTLVAAARLRELLGVPGMSSAVALQCRDKVSMSAAVAAAGLPTVGTLPVDSDLIVAEVAQWLRSQQATRVILKPRAGAASGGVREFASVEEFESRLGATGLPDNHEVQPFVDDPVCHLDAVVRGSEVLFLSAGRYLGTTLRYQRDREPMGSVSLDAAHLQEALAFASGVVRALGVTDSVVHIEAFLGADGFRFLEMGARFGGINITPHVRRVWGVDLRKESVAAQRLTPSEVQGPVLAGRRAGPGGRAPGGASGWLIVPRARPEACTVSGVRLPRSVPGVVEASHVQPGDRMTAQGPELDAVIRLVLDLPHGDESELEALARSLTDTVEVDLSVDEQPEVERTAQCP